MLQNILKSISNFSGLRYRDCRDVAYITDSGVKYSKCRPLAHGNTNGGGNFTNTNANLSRYRT